VLETKVPQFLHFMTSEGMMKSEIVIGQEYNSFSVVRSDNGICRMVCLMMIQGEFGYLEQEWARLFIVLQGVYPGKSIKFINSYVTQRTWFGPLAIGGCLEYSQGSTSASGAVTFVFTLHQAD
jgi:hypothetical protein